MSAFEHPPFPRKPGLRFLADVPSKVIGMCIFEDTLIVACEDGVYRKDADNNFVPILFDHGDAS